MYARVGSALIAASSIGGWANGIRLPLLCGRGPRESEFTLVRTAEKLGACPMSAAGIGRGAGGTVATSTAFACSPLLRGLTLVPTGAEATAATGAAAAGMNGRMVLADWL